MDTNFELLEITSEVELPNIGRLVDKYVQAVEKYSSTLEIVEQYRKHMSENYPNYHYRMISITRKEGGNYFENNS